MSSQETILSNILQRLDELNEQISKLDQRVSKLEETKKSPISTETNPENKDGLVAAIKLALEQLGGEADSSKIRAQITKNGLSGIERSDINKTLYRYKEFFEIAHQDGAKPIWKNRE